MQRNLYLGCIILPRCARSTAPKATDQANARIIIQSIYKQIYFLLEPLLLEAKRKRIINKI